MMSRLNPHFAAYYRRLILVKHLKFEMKGDTLLDVGCDDGFFLPQHQAGLSVGVDLRPRIFTGLNMVIVQADGCYLPFPDASFSTVLSFDVLEHNPDDATFLASLLRILAPRGCLWLSTPAINWRLFPGFLTQRAIRSWGHQRIGYDPQKLRAQVPTGYEVHLTLWGSLCFRCSYLLLRMVWEVSPSLARIGARLCFYIDRHLRQSGDHIFLQIKRSD